MVWENTEIRVIRGDITDQEVDAIVNPANNRFLMGGGVAGAIKKRGGEVIETEAVAQGPKQAGESIITSAGSLPAKHVIHSATMAMDFRTDADIIRKAAYSALCLAQRKELTSIAFCALGCGVGRFPYSACAKIMAQEVFRYLKNFPVPSLKKILFVLNSSQAHEVFSRDTYKYLEYMRRKMFEGPFLTVDGIVLYDRGIVMIERSNPPLGWALPGGFVDYGESVEQAVIREIKEETNLDFKDVRQFKVYSSPGRDPRFHTVSVVFTGRGEGVLRADSDARNAKVAGLKNLPAKVAFDHREIIKEWAETEGRTI